MKIEVSSLFHLEYSPSVATNTHIGDGVWLQEVINQKWLLDVLESRPLLAAKEKMDWGPFTHRFYVTVEGTDDDSDERVNNAEQLICQAIVLSRVVKPTPIPMYGARVRTIYPRAGEPYHLARIEAGFYGRAYVTAPRSELTILKDDAGQMAQFWKQFHQFYLNEPRYRRIVRALMYFDIAYHIYLLEPGHITLHAALESLICTNQRGKNKADVTKRLPQLVPFISENDAQAIYDLCVDFKHSAAPLFLYPNSEGMEDQRDSDRKKASQLLRDGLRYLFQQAIIDPEFAIVLSDVSKLRQSYPV